LPFNAPLACCGVLYFKTREIQFILDDGQHNVIPPDEFNRPVDPGWDLPSIEDPVEGIGPDDLYIMDQVWQISLDPSAYFICDFEVLLEDGFQVHLVLFSYLIRTS